METFPIYSLGSGPFLAEIFIALRWIAGNGDDSNNIFYLLGFIGVWLGALIIGFQAIYTGGKSLNNWGSLIGGAIVFAIMFGSTVDVEIQDVNSGQIIRVDSVPQGPAMIGFVVSSLGYEITSTFETAFAPVGNGVSSGQIGNTLKLLNDLRNDGSRQVVYNTIDIALGGGGVDVMQSLQNYISDCTFAGVDLGDIAPQQIYEGQMPNSLRYDHAALTTQMFINPPLGTYKTCTDAWTDITTFNTSLTSVEVETALNRLLGLDDTGSTWGLQIRDALDSLNLISVNSQEFVFASIVEPLWENAAARKYETMMDMNAAMTISSMIERRNLSWAAEETLFHQTIRPLLAFFEGFTYAIEPFVALLVVMSSFGTAIAIRYFQTLIWIQLWMPMAAIINLYMVMAAQNDIGNLTPIGNAAIDAASFYIIDEVDTVTSTWLAIGAKMMASIPVISLAVITGSSYGMVSLLDRVNQGNARAAETVSNNLSPGIMNMPNLVGTNSNYTANARAGIGVTDGDAKNQRILGASAQFKETVGTAQKEVLTSGQQLSSSITNARSDVGAQTFLNSVGRDFTSTISSQQTGELASSYNKALEIARGAGYNQDNVDGIAANIMAGVNIAGNGANISGNTGQSSSQSNFKQLNEKLMSQLSDNEKVALTDALSTSVANTYSNSDSQTQQNSSVHSLADQASKSLQHSNEYQNLSALSALANSGKTVDMMTNPAAANDLMLSKFAAYQNDPNATEEQKKIVSGLENRYLQMANEFNTGSGLDTVSQGARIADATLFTIGGALDSKDQNIKDLAQEMFTGLGQAYDIYTPEANPYSNLTTTTGKFESLNGQKPEDIESEKTEQLKTNIQAESVKPVSEQLSTDLTFDQNSMSATFQNDAIKRDDIFKGNNIERDQIAAKQLETFYQNSYANNNLANVRGAMNYLTSLTAADQIFDFKNELFKNGDGTEEFKQYYQDKGLTETQASLATHYWRGTDLEKDYEKGSVEYRAQQDFRQKIDHAQSVYGEAFPLIESHLQVMNIEQSRSSWNEKGSSMLELETFNKSHAELNDQETGRNSANWDSPNYSKNGYNVVQNESGLVTNIKPSIDLSQEEPSPGSKVQNFNVTGMDTLRPDRTGSPQRQDRHNR